MIILLKGWCKMRKELFKKWLKENTNLADGTISSYSSAIASISAFGLKENIIHQDIYEIKDVSLLNEIINLLESSEDYDQKNTSSNRRWSSALEQYKQFIMANNQVDNIDVIDSKNVSNSVYLKNEFEKWISEQVQSNGKQYSSHTQKGYIYSLEKACSEIKNLNLENSDLFTITSLEEFISVEEKIRNNDDFARVNQKFGNGQLSAGIIKYKEFLLEREKNNNSYITQVKAKKNSKKSVWMDRVLSKNSYGLIKI